MQTKYAVPSTLLSFVKCCKGDLCTELRICIKKNICVASLRWISVHFNTIDARLLETRVRSGRL